MLAAALGGPYVVNETELGQWAWQKGMRIWDAPGAFFSVSAPVGGYDHPLYTTETAWKGSLPPGVQQSRTILPSIVGGPVNDLRDVLRFDANPQWVTQHFSRVTTVLADVHLDGLRVPVVTGTQPEDLAGTITYYFDRQHRMQRINLHGFTGDPARLVQLMTQHYGMIEQPSLGAGTYVIRWNAQTTSVLQIVHAPVVHAEAFNGKYTVFLELNQPSMPYGLSEQADRLVSAGKGTFRW
jgi:hypothetical protein